MKIPFRSFLFSTAASRLVGAILLSFPLASTAYSNAPMPKPPASQPHHKHHKHHKHRTSADHKHHGMQHHFRDVKHWVKVFNNPKRTAWQKPTEVVQKMHIKPGMTVADIGAGTGYFLPYLRAAVGLKGQVLGLDISKPLVKYMQKLLHQSRWYNVRAILVKPDSPMLSPKSVDRILIVNTWHHIEHRVHYAKQLKAALKPNGALYIVDFTMQSKRGPHKKHRLTPQQVIKELSLAGFRAKVVPTTLPSQYIVAAR